MMTPGREPRRSPAYLRARKTISNLLRAFGLATATSLAWAAEPPPANAPPPSACDGNVALPRLSIAVSGLRTAQGVLTITLYPDDPDRFLARRGKLARIRVPATQAQTLACLPLTQPGSYAIAVYHDENNDGDFNRNWVGLPTEGYGFSNNPRLTLGPPPLEAVRFAVGSGETQVSIQVTY